MLFRSVCGLILAQRQGVLVRLDQEPCTLDGVLADLNVAGATLDTGGSRGLTSATWPPFRAYVRAVHSVAPTVLLDNLEPTWAKAAEEAGATHAVFSACKGVRV